MDIADWRKKIDELDQQLVRLINERAVCAVEIGKLKQGLAMPVYEPDRERIIFDHIAQMNDGPLSQNPVAAGLRATHRRDAPGAEGGR